MKSPDKYRFSLQWKAGTAEMVQAGEFLESLGNRKSGFVLLAVTEYLNKHPEVLSAGKALRIVVKQSYSRDQVEAIVKAMIEEKLTGMQFLPQGGECGMGESVAAEPDIDELLKNLDLFE